MKSQRVLTLLNEDNANQGSLANINVDVFNAKE